MKLRMHTRKGWLAVLPVLAVGAIAPVSAFGASDLSITKTDSADPVTENTELTYTLTVANAGPDQANGVTVEDKLPNELDFVSAVASQGTCTTQGKTVTCALGTLESGASATVELKTLATKAGQISNTATVTTTDTDSAPANNTDTETTAVVAPGGGGGGGGAGATCAGKAATIVGTEGADNLVGTEKNDVIVALGGDDTVQGLGGKDIVCGAAGNDSIKGKSGNDLLKGGSGNDQIRGGGGNDALRGAGGRDGLFGGAGADALFGGGGRDKCRGGGGSDTERSC